MFCRSFLFWVCLCNVVLYVSCSLVVNCWERTDFMAFLYVMFSCVLSLSHLSQVWYLIVSNPDLCPLPYFEPPHLILVLIVLGQMQH